MKKILTSLTLCCLAATLLTAQNLITKVPSNASVVIKYAGENFTTKVPLQKIDSYGFIKNNFFKMLHLDTLTSLQLCYRYCCGITSRNNFFCFDKWC